MNNPTLDGPALLDRLKNDQYVKYFVFQLERGESGTAHFQGYVEFRTPRALGSIRQLLFNAHVEARRGTATEAAEYCMKEDSRISDSYWEYGVRSIEPKSSSRIDLVGFREAVLSGQDTSALAETFTSEVAKYERFMHLVRRTQTPETRLELQVELHWGSTGTGKSFQAYRDHPGLWATPATDQMWFDGYDGQETVLLEEFAGQMKLDLLLRVLDRYPLQVPVKGSFVWFHPKKIIVTSNSHPFTWYKWEGRERKCFALFRRFTRIVEYGGVTAPNCPIDQKYFQEFEEMRYQPDRINILPHDATNDPVRFVNFAVNSGRNATDAIDLSE